MAGRTPSRGVRNNNPGNLDFNPKVKWQGLAGIETGVEHPRFAKFTTPQHGIRAIAKTLLTYQNAHGLKTVRGMINRWAPPVENNTSAYVKVVAEAVGVKPTDVVDVDEVATMLPLVRAIIHYENGYDPYPDATIIEGLRLAGVADAPPKPLVKKTDVWTQAGAAVASCGAAAATYSEPIHQVAQQLGPYASAPVIQRLVIVLTTAAGILAVSGILSTALKQRLEKRSALQFTQAVVDTGEVGAGDPGPGGGGVVGDGGGGRGEGE